MRRTLEQILGGHGGSKMHQSRRRNRDGSTARKEGEDGPLKQRLDLRQQEEPRRQRQPRFHKRSRCHQKIAPAFGQNSPAPRVEIVELPAPPSRPSMRSAMQA